MSSTEDKVKGNTNEAVGKIKQGVGEATDNQRLKGGASVRKSRARLSRSRVMSKTP